MNFETSVWPPTSPSVPSPHSFVPYKNEGYQAKADLFGSSSGSVSANNLANPPIFAAAQAQPMGKPDLPSNLGVRDSAILLNYL